MTDKEMFKKIILLLIVAYISPQIAVVIFVGWLLKYVYDLGQSSKKR